MAATQPQSYEVPGEAVPGETRARRHITVKDKPLVRVGDPNVTTLWAAFQKGVYLSAKKRCLGYRPQTNGVFLDYVFETFEEVQEHILNIGSALAGLGFERPGYIGIYSQNRREWVIADFACAAYNYVSVPLYDTLGVESTEYIVNQTEMRLVFLTKDKLKQLIPSLPKMSSLRYIVVMDGEPDKEHAKACAAVDCVIRSFTDFEADGIKNRKEPTPGQTTDIASICYTSGTTGYPKGVMLTHSAFISNSAAFEYLGKQGRSIEINANDVHISYLPLAHMLERIISATVLLNGASMGFYQGDPAKLLDDIAVLKPTFFPSVPRLLNRIHDKVWAGVFEKGGITQALFEYAYNTKKAGLANGTVYHWLWDRLVFANVRQRLGGNVRLMLTGSAPISPDVMDFLRICFSCDVLEGYGQTECVAGACLTNMGDLRSGHVGPPMPCTEIKLVDVKDMGYTSEDKPFPRGEVCFRGHNIMSGYFKQEDKTAEAIDADGWLHSGDIGLFDELGCLKIIDRKKNIFKLAQGEYLAPEKIENELCKNRFIAQTFVFGDSLQYFCVAIVHPDEEVLLRWCQSQSIEGTLQEVCSNPTVKAMIQSEIVSTAKAAGLKGFEIPKNIFLTFDAFTVENGLLTPTFKLKRHDARKHYEEQLSQLYAEAATQQAA